MAKIKNICLLIAVALQFSTSCFSQDSPEDQTNMRIIKLVNPVRILKISSNSVKSVNPTGTILEEINKNKIENLHDKINTNLIDQDIDTGANKSEYCAKSSEQPGMPGKTDFIKGNNKSLAVNNGIENLKEYQQREQKQLK